MKIPLPFNIDYSHCQTRFCCCCFFVLVPSYFAVATYLSLPSFLRGRVALDGWFLSSYFFLNPFCLWKFYFEFRLLNFSRGFLNCPHRVTFTSFKCFVKDDGKGGKPWLQLFNFF